MKKFGEGQQPFHAIIDIPEGDSQELTTVTDQALNSLYGELFNLLQTHGINPTTTTNADLKQVARAVWSAVNAGNLFIDNGSENIKNLTHVKQAYYLFKNRLSADDGFCIEFINKLENTGEVLINVFDVENNANHFQLTPLVDYNKNPLSAGSLYAGALIKARYDKNINAFVMGKQTVAAKDILDGSLTQSFLNAGVDSIADLANIQNATEGQRVFVRSYYKKLGVGGDDFYFTKATLQPIQGLVIKGIGGYWQRQNKNQYTVEDFGCHENNPPDINGIALKAAFDNVKNIILSKKYNTDMSKIKIRSGTRLWGGGELIGQDPDTIQADGVGVMAEILNEKDIIVRDITIKNGYRGAGFFVRGSDDIVFDNVTVDGFTYGIWVGENENKIGCKNVKISSAVIKNTRYWGIYIRCLDVVSEIDKTQNIVCLNSFFYNAHGAGFVCSEGNVKYVVLENPYFEDCNVCMHFEGTSNYAVKNPVTRNTGKKASHVDSPEYPFKAMSIYQAFANNAEITGGELDKSIYTGCIAAYKSAHHKYKNITMPYFTFEGFGDTKDVQKDFFTDYNIDGCTFTYFGIFYQESAAEAYIKDLNISNCLFAYAESGSTETPSIALNCTKLIDCKISNNSFKNSTLVLTCKGKLVFTDNIFNRTDGRTLVLNSVGNGLGDANFLEFTGNILTNAGGNSDSAITMEGWTRVRADSLVRCAMVGYGYRFKNIYAVELGGAMIYDYTIAKVVNENVSVTAKLYVDN